MSAAAPERAALIVAHPDDEILWFGSVVARVAALIVCFEDPGDPRIAAGRRRVAAAYPRAARWLGLAEPQSYDRTPWDDPRYVAHGLAARDPDTDRRLAASHAQLLELIDDELGEVGAIYTHNPWGEYGHADHALVHAVSRTIAERRGLPLSCPMLASRTSARAMVRQRAAWGPTFAASVDLEFCEQVRALYVEHGVWTWFDDWTFWAEDTFAPVDDGGGPIRVAAIRWIPSPLE